MPLWDLEKENQPAQDASLSLLPRCVSSAALVPALPRQEQPVHSLLRGVRVGCQSELTPRETRLP